MRDREGGTIAGEWVLALQAVQQRRFLAADVGSAATPHPQIESSLAAQETGRPGFLEGPFENLRSLRVFIAQVDEAPCGTCCVGCDCHPFDDRVRIQVHQGAVLEASGFALVGVADDCLWSTGVLRDGVPFATGGKSGAPAARQSAVADGLAHGCGIGCQRFFQAQVAAGTPVAVVRAAIRFPDGGEHALLEAARVGDRNGRVPGRHLAITGHQGLVSPEDRHRVVASTGARHRGGTLRTHCREEGVSTFQLADRSGAHPWGALSGSLLCEVVIEGDRPVEIGDRGSKCLRNGMYGLFPQEPVAVVECMQDRQKRGLRVRPSGENLCVGGRRHGP